MNRTLLIPSSRLSSNPVERHAQLRDYFCDKDASAYVNGEYWSLKLAWANEAERYVDPRLNEGLQWWGCDTYSEMATSRKRRGRFLLTLNDTWTLESWSQWLQTQSKYSLKEIVVLHVDDHKDLASPRLFQQSNGWCDPISGKAVDLSEPESIALAIESGALGMGSFLTPFLHAVLNVDVRHLCQAPKCTSTDDYEIQRTLVSDSLLDPTKLRPAIRLVENSTVSNIDRYRFTNDLDMWLEDIARCNKVVLLHIDMDYFCNRYDGDSDFIEKPGPNNPPIEVILKRIDELSSAIQRHGLKDKIADIVIAFSPGFFPAEFWSRTSERLLEGLGESA